MFQAIKTSGATRGPAVRLEGTIKWTLNLSGGVMQGKKKDKKKKTWESKVRQVIEKI